MELLLLPITHECLYWTVAAIVSVVYGARGIAISRHHLQVENATNLKGQLKTWGQSESILTHYLHDFIYNGICGLAGFVALFVEVILFTHVRAGLELTAGVAILLVFLSLVAILGIGGALPRVLFHGLLGGQR